MDEEGEGDDLRQVGAGLRLVLFGLAATVAMQLGFAVAGALFVKPGKDLTVTAESLQKSTLLRTLHAERPGAATVLNGLAVLACVLAIAGKVFCVRGSEAAGAAAFAVTSIACDAFGLALYATGQVGPAGEATADLVDIASLAWLMAYFFFLRYLARLAESLAVPRLLLRVRRQLVGTVGLVFGALLAAGLAASGGGGLLMVAWLVIAIAAMVLFVLYVRLLRDLRRAAEAAAATDGD